MGMGAAPGHNGGVLRLVDFGHETHNLESRHGGKRRIA